MFKTTCSKKIAMVFIFIGCLITGLFARVSFSNNRAVVFSTSLVVVQLDPVCLKTTVDSSEFINIPNVFTPDGDGINDYFTIANSGLKEYKIEIYDRWGIKVFESESALFDWDGRSTSGVAMSEGTYYYILKAISLNSIDYSTAGFLSLFRGK